MERRPRVGVPSVLRNASVSGLTGAVSRARTRAARRRGDGAVPEAPVAVAAAATPSRARRRALETALPFSVDESVGKHGRSQSGTGSRRVGRMDGIADVRDDDDDDDDDEDDEDDDNGWDTNVAADAAAAAAVAASIEADNASKAQCSGPDEMAPVDAAARKAAAKAAQARARSLARLRTAQAMTRYQANIVLLCACQVRMDTAANSEELQAHALSITPPDAVLDLRSLTQETLRRFALWYRCAFQAERLVEGTPVRRLCDIVQRTLLCISKRRGEVMDLVVLAAAAVRATTVRCRIVIPMQLVSFKPPPSSARPTNHSGRKIAETVPEYTKNIGLYGWLEIFIDGRWTHVDPLSGMVDAATAKDVENAIQSIDGLPVPTSGRTRSKRGSAVAGALSSKQGKPALSIAAIRARSLVRLHSDKISIAHVVAVENSCFTDVTRRYVRSWSDADKARPSNGLFEKTLARCSGRAVEIVPGTDSEHEPSSSNNMPLDRCTAINSACEPEGQCLMNLELDSKHLESFHESSPGQEQGGAAGRVRGIPCDVAKSSEQREFDEKCLGEDVPTTLTALRNHPLYCVERHLRKYEVVYPREPILGHVGPDREPVFLRSCVKRLHTRERWLREMREVIEDAEPIKNVKSRSRRDSSDMNDADLYGDWQTIPLVIPDCQNGIVPKNHRGNVELWTPAHLPKGGVHIPLAHAASTARRLGFDYAPCMTGFEIRSGRSVPRIEGIVIAEENANVVRDGACEAAALASERAENRAREEALATWKNLIRRVSARQRVHQKYGGMFGEEDEGTYEAIQKRRTEKKRKGLLVSGDALQAGEVVDANQTPGEPKGKDSPQPEFPSKRRKTSDAHDHNYDDGRHHEGDVWVKTCTICGMEVAYEHL